MGAGAGTIIDSTCYLSPAPDLSPLVASVTRLQTSSVCMCACVCVGGGGVLPLALRLLTSSARLTQLGRVVSWPWRSQVNQGGGLGEHTVFGGITSNKLFIAQIYYIIYQRPNKILYYMILYYIILYRVFDIT